MFLQFAGLEDENRAISSRVGLPCARAADAGSAAREAAAEVALKAGFGSGSISP